MASWFKPSVLAIVLLLSFPMFAIVIEEDTDESTWKLSDYLSFNLAWTLSGGNVARDILLVEANYQQSFLDDTLLINARADISQNTLTADLVLTERAEQLRDRGELNANLPDSIELTIKNKSPLDVVIGARYEFNEQWEVEAGNFLPDLGQFAVFSPVSFVLPISSEFTGFGFNRDDLFVPQLGSQFFYYPVDTLEISYYRSQPYEFDKLYYEVASQSISSPDREKGLSNRAVTDILDIEHGEFFRVLLQKNWGALGVTIYDGPSSFAVTSLDQWKCKLLDNENSMPCPDDLDSLAGNSSIQLYRDYQERAEIPHVNAIGFEASYSNGDGYTWIGEVLYTESDTTINGIENDQTDQLSEFQSGQYALQKMLAIYRFNQGKSYLPTKNIYFGAGFETSSDDRRSSLGFQLLGIINSWDSKYDDLVDTLSDEDSMFLGVTIAPSFLYYRKMTLFNYETSLVSGAGFFGGFGGFFANQVVEFTENISGLVGISAIFAISDNDLFNQIAGDEYELNSEGGIGFNLGLAINY